MCYKSERDIMRSPGAGSRWPSTGVESQVPRRGASFCSAFCAGTFIVLTVHPAHISPVSLLRFLFIITLAQRSGRLNKFTQTIQPIVPNLY